VSDAGQVQSLTRVTIRKNGSPLPIRGRMMSPSCGDGDYLYVCLHGLRLDVAHLVLEAFKGPRPDGLLALHVNDVKADNRLENLCWGTVAENSRHAVINGRIDHRGSRNGRAKLTEEQVMEICSRHRTAQSEGRAYGHRKMLATEFGVTPGIITDIVCGRKWKHVQG
jgi:hypothetical protein